MFFKQIDPEDHHSYDNLAYIYNRLGQFDKGAEQSRLMVDRAKTDPTEQDSFAIDHLANAYLGLNRYDEARALLETAAQLAPTARPSAASAVSSWQKLN
jgi:tetratricopeptide (TPR) repeat protein